MVNKFKEYRIIKDHLKLSNYIQMQSVLNMIRTYERKHGKDVLFDKLEEMYYIKIKQYETDEI